MEEIKFRMRNKSSDGKYFYSTDTTIECLKQQMLFDEDKNNILGHNHIEDGKIFEQYTGLKDKNGKEIYEGDIIKYKDKTMRVYGHEGGFVIKSPYFSDSKEDLEPSDDFIIESLSNPQTKRWLLDNCEII